MAMDDFLTQLLNGLGFGEKKSDNQKNGEGDNESDISQFSFDSYQWLALCSGNFFEKTLLMVIYIVCFQKKWIKIIFIVKIPYFLSKYYSINAVNLKGLL